MAERDGPEGRDGPTVAVAHALLAAAGLRMTEAEADRLAAGYRVLRERTDGLYAIGGDAAAPALGFDPTDR